MLGGRRSRAFVKTTMAISVVAFGVASCRQIGGIDDRVAADSCGATPERTAQCGECMAIDCCAELTACAADPACARAQACLARCDDSDDRCRSACAESARDGYDGLLARVVACRTNACATACSAGCGAGAPASTECATCTASSCCAEQTACSANPTCLTQRWRRERCSDSSCRDLNDARNDAGNDDDSRLQVCLDARCSKQCASWGCVTPPAPRPPAGKVSVTLAMVESFKLRPLLAPLRVKACNRNDPTCKIAAAGEVMTGIGGAATFEDLPVSAATDAFDGYFEVVDPAGARIPMLVFLEPPVRASRSVAVLSLTQAERAQFHEALGVSPDPRTAIVGVHALDCTGAEGAGVKLAFDGDPAEPIAFYLDRRLPTPASATSSTDHELAFGGFVGVPPGSKTVIGRWIANDMELFRAPIYVREGGFTYVSFSARP